MGTEVTVRVVALPIGNADDLSPRAKAALQSADLIFCEDTRKLGALLARVNVTVSARKLSQPGDQEWNQNFSALVEQGYLQWVLVSDAGTPVVNDPGLALLRFCHERQIPVQAIPGPSAPILLWQWSGGFGVPFVFAGFAPKGSSDLQNFFGALNTCRSFCFFDTKHQFKRDLEFLIQAGQGNRKIFVGREMSKAHEELFQGEVQDVVAWFDGRMSTGEVGELTVLIEGDAQDPTISTIDRDELLRFRVAPVKEASKLLAKWTGLSARDCYQSLIAQSSGGPGIPSPEIPSEDSE